MQRFTGVFMKAAFYMRKRRFKYVNMIILAIIARKGKCNILDIGGSSHYWSINKYFLQQHADKITITITNIDAQEVNDKNTKMFTYIEASACDVNVYDKSYDLIHSNSLLEHVGGWDILQRIAELVQSQDAPFYIQTPNYWFPVEPHFRMIGFHWLPISWRANDNRKQNYRRGSGY